MIGAALLFISSNDIFGGVRDAALTSVVVVVALGLILAPFLWRLGRSLALERAERIRSQERAEVAAHLHDSVLQTLALMQKRADDPREVAALARRQERELRSWLAGSGDEAAGGSFAAALRSVAEEIEDERRVAIETVIVGDCELDEGCRSRGRRRPGGADRTPPSTRPSRGRSGSSPRSRPARSRSSSATAVRASTPTSVSADRRGVRESILGRMRRAGGRAEISSPGEGGTEVALEIGRAGVEGSERR